MKAVGYVRVSTAQQADDGHSLDAQRQKVQQYCDLYDLDLVGIHADEGASGKDLNRSGLTEALNALTDEADTLVVVKLDRLTRSVADLNRLLEEHFASDGSEIVSVSENVDTSTPAGRLVLNMLMSVSQWEREVISQRTSDAMQHMADENRYTGTVPFGYRLCEDGEHVEPDPAEQEIIRATLELRASGLTYRAISARLADEGYVNRKGNPFGPSSIGNIIKNNDLSDFTDHEERDAPTQGRGGASEGKAAPATGANPADDTDEHKHQTSPIDHEGCDHEEDTDATRTAGNFHRGRSREDHRALGEDDPTPREKRTAESSRRRQRDAVQDQPSRPGSLVA